ncbi:hypothetical protein SAMN05421869_12716 [Nonomuraea jiangxiensis]|uniref:DDE superfamily endonuclease n=1 Tax=Nonomuraea jiangxiensis TaxID=633440 RepID=A0A1G9KX99_9ACTN|nr:hypothetical protein SAMN05421869_12716 [Nonomuraea jiangxiensis]
MDLLAALADDVHAAVKRASRLAYTILDGTLIPIDRLADERPYYSGKHKQQGMNVQLLADPAGRLAGTTEWIMRGENRGGSNYAISGSLICS